MVAFSAVLLSSNQRTAAWHFGCAYIITADGARQRTRISGTVEGELCVFRVELQFVNNLVNYGISMLNFLCTFVSMILIVQPSEENELWWYYERKILDLALRLHYNSQTNKCNILTLILISVNGDSVKSFQVCHVIETAYPACYAILVNHIRAKMSQPPSSDSPLDVSMADTTFTMNGSPLCGDGDCTAEPSNNEVSLFLSTGWLTVPWASTVRCHNSGQCP